MIASQKISKKCLFQIIIKVATKITKANFFQKFLNLIRDDKILVKAGVGKEYI